MELRINCVWIKRSRPVSIFYQSDIYQMNYQLVDAKSAYWQSSRICQLIIWQIMTSLVPWLGVKQLLHIHPVWSRYPQHLRFCLHFCLSVIGNLVDYGSSSSLTQFETFTAHPPWMAQAQVYMYKVKQLFFVFFLQDLNWHSNL